jgi:hypothetical protein
LIRISLAVTTIDGVLPGLPAQHTPGQIGHFIKTCLARNNSRLCWTSQNPAKVRVNSAHPGWSSLTVVSSGRPHFRLPGKAISIFWMARAQVVHETGEIFLAQLTTKAWVESFFLCYAG